MSDSYAGLIGAVVGAFITGDLPGLTTGAITAPKIKRILKF